MRGKWWIYSIFTAVAGLLLAAAACSLIGEDQPPWDTDISEGEAFDGDRAGWGPEGCRIVFEHNGPLPDTIAGAPGQLAVNQLWVADLETGIRRFVLRGPAVAPDWSPDSQQIAFIHHSADGSGEAFLMRSDGAEIRQVTQGSESVEQVEWHPEGKPSRSTGSWRTEPIGSTCSTWRRWRSAPSSWRERRNTAKEEIRWSTTEVL